MPLAGSRPTYRYPTRNQTSASAGRRRRVAAFFLFHIFDRIGHKLAGALYGKVVEVRPEAGTLASIRFTSMSPEIESFIRNLVENPKVETARGATHVAGEVQAAPKR